MLIEKIPLSLTKSEHKCSVYLATFCLWSMLARFSVYATPRGGVFIYGSYIIVFLLLYLSKRNLFDKKNTKYFFYVLLPFAFAYSCSYFVNGIMVETTPFLMLFFASTFVLFNDKIKTRALDIFIRYLAIILFLSLIEYLFAVFTGVIFSIGTVYNGNDLIRLTFNNGIFNLFLLYQGDMFRFQSLATEPGLIGTLCGFLIYIVSDIKEYKYAYYIFWISGILSFSLAFYIIAAIQISSKFNLKYIVVIAIICFFAYHYMPDFFEEHIVSRISGDEHGDNRSSVELDFMLAKSFENGSLWFGNGYRSYDSFVSKGVAGAKPWIYQYGIVAVVLLFISYMYVFIDYSKKKGIHFTSYLIFLFVFTISFYQRQTVDTPYTVIAYFATPCIWMYKKKYRNNLFLV